MNFIRGATPTFVAQTEIGLDYTDICGQTEIGQDYTHIMVTSRGAFIKVKFRASFGVKRSTLMWMSLSRQKA